MSAAKLGRTPAGNYERTLQTQAGEVSLKVPKLRRQTFETAIIERAIADGELGRGSADRDVPGEDFGTPVEDITEALWGTRVSPSTVSNLNNKIYAKIEAWRNRRIEGEHPLSGRDRDEAQLGGRGSQRVAAVASAVNSEGYREIFWASAKAPKLVGISAPSGRSRPQRRAADYFRCLPRLDRERRGVLPEARWQRCMIHFYRNVFSHVPAAKVRDVAHMLKAIHAQESREAAEQKARMIIEELKACKMSKAAELVEQAVNETLTYYAFPDIHWQKIRTNNPLERIMREILRRTRVVGAFPDGQSCLNLAAARLRYIAASAWSTKR